MNISLLCSPTLLCLQFNTFYLNIFLNVNYSSDGKVEFSTAKNQFFNCLIRVYVHEMLLVCIKLLLFNAK